MYKCLNENDFIAVTETKLSNIDLVEVEGYTFFSVNRTRAKHASGGVGLFVRDSLCSFVQQVSITSEFSMMVEIDKKLCGQNILLCVVYIPPESSPYSSMDMFDDLENQFLESEMFCNGAEICMLGDFNGRTAQLSDLLEKDDHVDRVSSVSEMLDCLNNAVCDLPDVELKRCSSDSCTNNYGYRLVDMCKNMGVVIVNGRFGADRGVGKPLVMVKV